MSQSSFKALVLRRPADENAANDASVEELTESDLPQGDVVVQVRYSDLNYKDGLAIMGAGSRQMIVRHFPFVPGIDFAGIVEHSDSDRFQPGDEVVLTGWGVGEAYWGGFAQKARVKSDWLLKLPSGMTMRQAMALGTAGFSAMLCVDTLERYGIDKSREVLVTGAGGGVGSVAVVLLHALGYRAVASTGRTEEETYFCDLGAESIIDRTELAAPPERQLLRERWGGAIDTVGGPTLAHVLASMAYGCAVASVGLAGGRRLDTTVLPFILRGVALLGVDSVYCPMDRRVKAWSRVAELLPDGLPNQVMHEIGLEEVPAKAAEILKGHVRGRTIITL